MILHFLLPVLASLLVSAIMTAAPTPAITDESKIPA